MKRILLTTFVIAGLVMSSCQEEADPGRGALLEMSNEWWGQIYVPDGSGGLTDIQLGYQHLLTSGTAANTTDSLFVDDFDGLLELKAKVACDPGSLSFSNGTNAVIERYTGGTVIISNGRIYIAGGRSASGVVVDSIYFEAEFDWDPGQIYVIAGHGRTGFLEDEF